MTDEFDPGRMLVVLSRHQVQYVVIGGIAARLHGASRPTTDLDVTPAMEHDNLRRLADALRELGARLRVQASRTGCPGAPMPPPWPVFSSPT